MGLVAKRCEDDAWCWFDRYEQKTAIIPITFVDFPRDDAAL